MHDILYYPELIDAIGSSVGPINGIANLIVYPNKVGKYKYYDDEGTFTINPDATVTASPADNPLPYTHPLPQFIHGKTMFKYRPGQAPVMFVPRREVEIAENTYFV